MFISTPLFNHILSFRPTHPIAVLIRDDIQDTINLMDEEKSRRLRKYTSFINIGMYVISKKFVFKQQSLWEIDASNDYDRMKQFPNNVIFDYRQIYAHYGYSMLLPQRIYKTKKEEYEARKTKQLKQEGLQIVLLIEEIEAKLKVEYEVKKIEEIKKEWSNLSLRIKEICYNLKNKRFSYYGYEIIW